MPITEPQPPSDVFRPIRYGPKCSLGGLQLELWEATDSVESESIRIFMPWIHVKALVSQLYGLVVEHEEAFGEIPSPPFSASNRVDGRRTELFRRAADAEPPQVN